MASAWRCYLALAVEVEDDQYHDGWGCEMSRSTRLYLDQNGYHYWWSGKQVVGCTIWCIGESYDGKYGMRNFNII